MRYSSLWLSLLVLVSACSQKSTDKADDKKSQVLFTSSFENLEGWVPENPSLTKEKAHAGAYSVKVDPAIEYSLTYINQLGRLSPTRISKLRLSAWSFLTKPGKAAIVVQINSPDASNTSVFYEKVELDQVEKWTETNKVMTLPAVMDPASQIKVYLWRASATGPAYLDDIQLSVEQ